MYLILIITIIALLLFVWDLKARKALSQYRKVEANEYKANVIPKLAVDPLWQYLQFFYQTVFIRQSEYVRTPKLLLNNDDLKTRAGKRKNFLFTKSNKLTSIYHKHYFSAEIY